LQLQDESFVFKKTITSGYPYCPPLTLLKGSKGAIHQSFRMAAMRPVPAFRALPSLEGLEVGFLAFMSLAERDRRGRRESLTALVGSPLDAPLVSSS